MPNVPPLRFPEFSGEWEKCQLQQIASISKGSGISKEQLSDAGEPCILYGELYTKYKSEVIDEVISKTNIDSTHLIRSLKNDVIIPSSGETAIDISTARCVPYDNILLGGDLSIIRLKEQDGRFFSYQLNGVRKPDIAKVAQGVSVVHLYGDSLSKLLVSYPTLKEQYKIADFLHKLDQCIATQIRVIDKLESLIKGIYQKVFESSDANYLPLAQLCTIQKGEQVNSEGLTETGDYYVMNGGITPSGYYSRYNSVADTISVSEGGNSCGYVQYNTECFWSGGHCYTLTDVNQSISKCYLYHYLKYKEKEIMALRIGSGLPNIQKKDLSKFPILILPLSEQQRVANLLQLIAEKIKVEKDNLNHLSKQKAYLLQNMFI